MALDKRLSKSAITTRTKHEDYLTAIDYMAEKPYVDKDRLGCVVQVMRIFSVLASRHHENVSKHLLLTQVFLIWNSKYLETEEMWFANWDMGGAYWEKDNAIAQRTYAASPHRTVDKWDTRF